MRVPAFLLLGILMLAPEAHAAGINLSWNECGNAGARLQQFACDSNDGAPFELVGSFVPPEGLFAYYGEEIVLDFFSCDTVPNWWRFKNAGTCRQNALSASADFVSHPLGVCSEYWAGAATGGITAYLTPWGGDARRAHILAIFTMPYEFARSMDWTQEYYAFRLSIARSNTVGPSACEGCLQPAQIVLNEIKLLQLPGEGNIRVQNRADYNYAFWQRDSGSDRPPCPFVPVRNQTWGAIKTLYR